METRRKSPLVIVVPILLVVIALLAGALLKQRAQPVSPPGIDATTASATTLPPASGMAPAGGLAHNIPASTMPGGSDGLRGKVPMTEGDRVKALAERDRQMAAFEQSHRAEPIDAAWATKAKTDLDAIVTSEAMQGAGIKPVDYSADCRSTTCRVAAQFKSSGDAEDWGTFFLTSSGKTIRQAKMTVVQNPNGGAEVRIYGTRR